MAALFRTRHGRLGLAALAGLATLAVVGSIAVAGGPPKGKVGDLWATETVGAIVVPNPDDPWVVAQLALPAGNYLLEGRVTVEATSASLFRCYLGDSEQSLDVPANQQGEIVIHRWVGFSAPGNASLLCGLVAGASAGDVSHRMLTALKVGKIR